MNTPEEIAVAVMESEQMMWLMVGSNHPESHLNALREAWKQYKEAGGGTYGHPMYIRASIAVQELHAAMMEIKQSYPAFEPGTDPTAADHCKELLQMTEWCIKQLSTFMGVRLSDG